MRIAFTLLCLIACSTPKDPGARLVMNLDGEWKTTDTFFDHPFPSTLRMKNGAPDAEGYPDLGTPLLRALVDVVPDRQGVPVMPVSYFQFDRPVAAQDPETVRGLDASSPILIIDIDAAAGERGTLTPAVAKSLPVDASVPPNVLAVAPRPGFVLPPERKHGVVILRALGDADGEPLGVADALGDLTRGRVPGGAFGEQAAADFADLWLTLDEMGIDRSEVAAATVFETGDPVRDLHELSEAVRETFDAELLGLEIDPDDGNHDSYCELVGTMELPQFQTGTPPYNTGGLFELDSVGVPIAQRSLAVPIVISLPAGEMPAGGYPLVQYFHGSGGVASEVVDRGRTTMVGGPPTKGEGPAFVLARRGIATAGSAHPVNPERLPGASDTEYLNLQNLAAMRDTFRQGVLEQRLYLDALLELRIAPETVSGCPGLSLPAGETAYRFDADRVGASGQSMGGMYTNLIAAVEPRHKVTVPTGAGGYWPFFIFETSLVPGATDLLSVLLRTPHEEISFLHPGMHLTMLAWEPIEPFVFMNRLAARPLPGHPARPIYQPAGQGDKYFPTPVFDAAALAYGNEQAGEMIWDTSQEALALASRDGMVDYPVVDNVESAAGAPYTGVLVQYEGDGISDPHAIYAQLDAVKHQYGCFLQTFFATGRAIVPAPGAADAPCE